MNDIDQPMDKAGALGPLDELVGYHLRRASGAFSAHYAHSMAGTGLRQVLFGILSIVAASPGIGQSAVGRLLGVKRANMVSLINDLVARGLLDRKVAPGDRRAFALTLTAAGDDTLAGALAAIRSHEQAMLAPLGADERVVLTALLKRIAAAAERDAPAD